MRAHFKVIGALVAALVLLSGCGGSSSNQTETFKTNLKPVLDQFGQISHDIGTAITNAPSQTDAQAEVTFGNLADRWQSQVNHLKTLTPPASVSAAYNTLTSTATRAESDLKAVVDAGKAHSSAAAKQAFLNLVNDVSNAKAAATTIADKLGIK